MQQSRQAQQGARGRQMPGVPDLASQMKMPDLKGRMMKEAKGSKIRVATNRRRKKRRK